MTTTEEKQQLETAIAERKKVIARYETDIWTQKALLKADEKKLEILKGVKE